MSASVVEQILARVKDALAGNTRAGASVFRAHQAAFGQDEHPAINIRRGNVDSSAHAQTLTRHQIAFELELHDEGEDWETQVDAFHLEAHALLAGDATLNGMGRGLLCLGTETRAEAADFIAGRLTATYQIFVLTRPGDLTCAVN